MSTKAGPNIITDGLVLNIDPANVKSYPAKNDPYRDQVSLLLDGASFTDKSRNNFTVTTYGNAQIVSDNAFGNAMSFDGNGDYLAIPTSTALALGSDPFTVELWLYMNTIPASGARIILYTGNSSGSYILRIEPSTGYIFSERNYTSTNEAKTNVGVQAQTWTHVAITRDSSSVMRTFLNGVQYGSGTVTSSYSSSGGAIAATDTGSQGIDCKIGPLRIIKGAALYTSNFTPSLSFSAPTRITDTKGKSVGTLTNGPVFSNIQDGVMSFDGSNDYIEFDTPALVTNNATISFWINANQTESQFVNYVFSMGNGSSQNFSVNIGGTYSDYRNPAKAIGLFVNNSVYSSTVANTFTTTDYYKWNHICISYDYSTGVKIYKNGILLSMFSNEVISTTVSSHNKINLGRRTDGQFYYNGKLSDVKLYNKALSYDEVQKIYTATRKRFVETPKTIPGLQLWLDGADLSTMRQNSNGTTAVAVNGDPVGYWGDKSGNGRHATQATAGNRPLFYIDSAGAYLNLNGTSSVLTGSIPLTITELTAYAIFSIGSGGYTYARLFTIWDNTSGASAKDWNITDKMILMYKPSASAMGINRNQAAQNTSHSLTYDQNYLFKTQHTGSVGSSQVNNGTPQSITWNHNGYYNAFNIGTEPNYAGYLKGKVREIIFFNRSLSSEENVIIKNYLNQKWNVF